MSKGHSVTPSHVHIAACKQVFHRLYVVMIEIQVVYAIGITFCVVKLFMRTLKLISPNAGYSIISRVAKHSRQ